ncbi:hypothetical protein JTB14_017128 [Gonioctena quinquepunctata]|nr:hypothetical protein JTB14_017128 [Gonioctena quinquepunctata]
MADNFGKMRTLRQIQLNGLDDLLAAAEVAKSDKSCEPLFKIRYQKIDDIKFEFNKQSNSIGKCTFINAVLIKDSLPDGINIKREFDSCFHQMKAINEQLSQNSRMNTEITFASVSPIPQTHIELVKFKGDIQNFTTYFDVFNALVNNNSSLQ